MHKCDKEECKKFENRLIDHSFPIIEKGMRAIINNIDNLEYGEKITTKEGGCKVPFVLSSLLFVGNVKHNPYSDIFELDETELSAWFKDNIESSIKSELGLLEKSINEIYINKNKQYKLHPIERLLDSYYPFITAIDTSREPIISFYFAKHGGIEAEHEGCKMHFGEGTYHFIGESHFYILEQ